MGQAGKARQGSVRCLITAAESWLRHLLMKITLHSHCSKPASARPLAASDLLHTWTQGASKQQEFRHLQHEIITYYLRLSKRRLPNITFCCPLKVNGLFGAAYHLHLQGPTISQVGDRRETICLHANFLFRLFIIPVDRRAILLRKVGWLTELYPQNIEVFTMFIPGRPGTRCLLSRGSAELNSYFSYSFPFLCFRVRIFLSPQILVSVIGVRSGEGGGKRWGQCFFSPPRSR
jgi:hypothetical protein